MRSGFILSQTFEGTHHNWEVQTRRANSLFKVLPPNILKEVLNLNHLESNYFERFILSIPLKLFYNFRNLNYHNEKFKEKKC